MSPLPSAEGVWSTLGREGKLALARRHAGTVARFLDGLDASVRGVVLERCDKYAADDRRRASNHNDGRASRRR